MGNFEFKKSLLGGNEVPAVKKLPVAGSQTLVVGDLVVLSSGQVAKASASVATVLGVMAQDSASATAGTLVDVYICQPGQVWKAVADADASSDVLAGKTYDINTNQTIDIADSSNGCIQILETVDSNTDVRVVFTSFELA